jgi:hypothetical protein
MEMVRLLLRNAAPQRNRARPDSPESALCEVLTRTSYTRLGQVAGALVRAALAPAVARLFWTPSPGAGTSADAARISACATSSRDNSRKTECGTKHFSAVLALLVCALLPGAASAAGFTLAVGPPVAAGTGTKVVKTKAATFVVRLEECEDLATARIGGTAEGVVNGVRTSAPLTLSAATQAGVYLVSQDWASEGVWVVSLSSTCGRAKAGAIVPMGPQGFLRDGTKILPRAATKGEIDSALKALERPGK